MTTSKLFSLNNFISLKFDFWKKTTELLQHYCFLVVASNEQPIYGEMAHEKNTKKMWRMQCGINFFSPAVGNSFITFCVGLLRADTWKQVKTLSACDRLNHENRVNFFGLLLGADAWKRYLRETTSQFFFSPAADWKNKQFRQLLSANVKTEVKKVLTIFYFLLFFNWKNFGRCDARRSNFVI